MAAIIDAEKCTGCGDCVDQCPLNAISLDDEPKAVINEDECTDCGTCVEACPSQAISMPT
ncbi:MAG: 4Fe-4S binding protein [Candidatus Sumerlaeia bacterium]|nr:4Fe-4S binding protein [Candidatus Sumerlaeia bacterium]